jgi:glucose-6-phosphate 1-dehydrogenase
LPVTCTEVFALFHRPPQRLFADRELGRARNYFRFRISPDEVIAIGARDKKPGENMEGHDVELKVKETDTENVSAYERLLGAALDGDTALFARQDTVEAGWRVVDAVLHDPPPVYEYQPGAWGPSQTDQLLRDGETWHHPIVTEAAS